MLFGIYFSKNYGTFQDVNKFHSNQKTVAHSLKPTAKTLETWWETSLSFWVSAYFPRSILSLGRVNFIKIPLITSPSKHCKMMSNPGDLIVEGDCFAQVFNMIHVSISDFFGLYIKPTRRWL